MIFFFEAAWSWFVLETVALRGPSANLKAEAEAEAEAEKEAEAEAEAEAEGGSGGEITVAPRQGRWVIASPTGEPVSWLKHLLIRHVALQDGRDGH